MLAALALGPLAAHAAHALQPDNETLLSANNETATVGASYAAVSASSASSDDLEGLQEKMRRLEAALAVRSSLQGEPPVDPTRGRIVYLQGLTYIINTLLILAITIIGYMHTAHTKRREALVSKRDSVEKACQSMDMDFAIDFFGDATFEGLALDPRDFTAIFYEHAGKKSDRHRQIRKRLIVFAEQVRPALHELGTSDASGNSCLRGPLDPIAFRLRLSLRAYAEFWNVRTHSFDSELEEHAKDELRTWLGGDDDWRLMKATLARLGLPPLDERIGEAPPTNEDTPEPENDVEEGGE